MKLFKIVSFMAFIAWELIVANIEVTREVLKPVRKLRPALLKVPLDATSDVEITFLASTLTMLPGTVSLDVTDDRRHLYVHVLTSHDPEQTRRDIKQRYERRILELLR